MCNTEYVFSDPVIVNVKENTKVLLNFTKPELGGVYEEIRWYKDTTSSVGRIVFLHPTATEGKPMYYNEYCTESSPCDTSRKGQLKVNTGEFTINEVTIFDEGFYYYRYYINNGSPDTGHKYEIDMKVYGKSFFALQRKPKTKISRNLQPISFL